MFPGEFKLAKVIPVHKKGSTYQLLLGAHQRHNNRRKQ